MDRHLDRLTAVALSTVSQTRKRHPSLFADIYNTIKGISLLSEHTIFEVVYILSPDSNSHHITIPVIEVRKRVV